MESRAPTAGEPDRESARARLWPTLVKTAIGIALISALVYLGRINFTVLFELVDAPRAIAIAAGLLFLSLPLAALRWGILLRAFGLSIPFGHLFHFVAIGTLTNVLFLGTLGGDAVRGLYAWRALRTGGGRIAMSILADRLISLLAALLLAAIFTAFNWYRILGSPALTTLAAAVFLALAGFLIGASAVLFVPGLVRRLERYLAHWRRAFELLVRTHEMVLMLRSNPLWLLSALAFALAMQILSAAAVFVVVEALKINALSIAELMFAVPVTLIANALPLTPNGLGVGEAAFDQICRWLEETPSGAAYSSAFFAFRIVSMLLALPGLVSLVVYRKLVPSTPSG